MCIRDRSLQCTTCCDGYRRDQETCTDDSECCFACGNCLRICGKHADQLSRNCQADDCSDQHDHTTHAKCDEVDFFYTFMFTGTIVVSDDRAHALYNPACRKIQESLQFVVNSQNHHITLGIGCQKSIQCRNQDRRKCNCLLYTSRCV